MEKKGKNLRYLRENNTREVLKYLALNGDCSRIKLSKELGLSKMTITNIVNDLLKSDYICESEFVNRENVGCTGPKPILLSVKRNKIIAIGVFVSRERLICSLSDIASGEFYVDQYKLDLSNVSKTFVSDVCLIVQKALDYFIPLHYMMQIQDQEILELLLHHSVLGLSITMKDLRSNF